MLQCERSQSLTVPRVEAVPGRYRGAVDIAGVQMDLALQVDAPQDEVSSVAVFALPLHRFLLTVSRGSLEVIQIDGSCEVTPPWAPVIVEAALDRRSALRDLPFGVFVDGPGRAELLAHAAAA